MSGHSEKCDGGSDGSGGAGGGGVVVHLHCTAIVCSEVAAAVDLGAHALPAPPHQAAIQSHWILLTYTHGFLQKLGIVQEGARVKGDHIMHASEPQSK